MILRVLGCSGAEFPGSNSPAFLLDEDILFDAGSVGSVLDLEAQLKITTIFVSHAHLDHLRGIPFLMDNVVAARENRKDHRVNVISIPPVIRSIREHLFNSSLWPDFTMIPHREEGVLGLTEVMSGNSVTTGQYRVTLYQVNHTVPATGFLVEDREMRRFFYTGDTGPCSDTWKKIGDKLIHCLIIDVSFPDRLEEFAIKTGHLTPGLLQEECLKMCHVPERIYITHLKPQHLEAISTDLEKHNMKNTAILREGCIISI